MEGADDDAITPGMRGHQVTDRHCEIGILDLDEQIDIRARRPGKQIGEAHYLAQQIRQPSYRGGKERPLER